MKISRKENAPRYRRDEGITSYLLVSARTTGAERLTTTLVEIEPGGRQRLHAHRPEQTYHILEGAGIMTVGEETQRIHAGMSIFIPSNAPHALANDGEKTLRYFSAASPSFERSDLESFWPIESEEEGGAP